MATPRFVVLEGADGAGTTTQARRLADAWRARGRAVHQTQQPSALPHGREIRERLKAGALTPATARELALLFALDRLEHVRQEIEPALARGEDVISDRYLLSSLVYQGLDVDTGWVRTLNAHARAPDLCVYVRVSADVAWQRVGARGGAPEVFERQALQRRVHERYDALFAEVGAVSVSGDGSVDEVAAAIEGALSGAGLP
jgi:dTMP kinase